jgi:cysteine desulfurase family protein
MPPATRIYLDNAATSWPKPPAVYEAVDRYLREVGAPAGRGAYREAIESDRIVAATRAGVARVIGADDPRRIVFTSGATESLNLALHGWLRPGDHVVTTAVEHNSVLRPLRALSDLHGVRVSHVSCGGTGRVDPDDVRRALRSDTRLVAVVHASNVTGTLQPVAEIAQLARDVGAAVLVDAAQTLGHLPLAVDELQADLVAASGHKGLLGPLGTGILYIRPGCEDRLRSLRQGGTGTHSEDDRQPESLPDKYESGNQNLPGIAGLGAAVEHLERLGIATISAQLDELTSRLRDGLSQFVGVRVYGPAAAKDRTAVVSLTISGYDPQEVAMLLDSTFRIQVRGGLHCAPLIHRAIGSFSSGGTVRLSPGPMNTPEEIDAAVRAIGELAAAP